MKQRSERVQKYLANLGVASRRQVEAWIADGKIRINGRTAKPGDRVTDQCQININGRPLRLKQGNTRQRVLVYNKPEGEICSRNDPSKRPNVFRNLPRIKGQRWVAVGRLDVNTSGLLLFTNDGQLANQLMHPSSELEREYMSRVFGDVSKADIDQLKAGVEIDGHVVAFKQIRKKQGEGKNTWYSVVVSEGRYREVRRLWEAVGCRVSRLIRVRFGPIGLPRRLRQGFHQELKSAEIARLIKAVSR